MRELYEKIKKGTDRRASLIALKKELKDEAKKKVFHHHDRKPSG